MFANFVEKTDARQTNRGLIWITFQVGFFADFRMDYALDSLLTN